MSLPVVLLASLAAVALGALLVRTVRRDGLGHRPPPPSRHDDTAAPGRTLP
ncbi:hypothetical protein J1G44_13695 [Cellulomonas sp. zg-ZUI199]|uniref:Uncharacterized protein n=1 Tax=Cellulomonas wangleii TaxID=2816956 RepID=A0ABX8D0J4_9CELL|nr:hypothetical protein [Cellulomonas wangleii]MBO0925529.1 hypothetical protein [Cellulomonas wangleii]QVI61003.1 hypothetical protein KG103_10730 [Cellulomonas wangleii]